jgi:hypothetical protein
MGVEDCTTYATLWQNVESGKADREVSRRPGGPPHADTATMW